MPKCFEDILISIWVISINKPFRLVGMDILVSFLNWQVLLLSLKLRLWHAGCELQAIQHETNRTTVNDLYTSSGRTNPSPDHCVNLHRWAYVFTEYNAEMNQIEKTSIWYRQCLQSCSLCVLQRPQNQPAIGKLAFFFFENVVQSFDFK